MTVVSRSTLEAVGACDRDCSILSDMYGHESIRLVVSELPAMRDRGVYVFHAVRLLSFDNQKRLAGWSLNAALDGMDSDCLPGEIEKCFGAGIEACDAEVTFHQARMREAGGDAISHLVHGVAFTYARLARLYANGASTSGHEVMIGFDVLRRWSARCQETRGLRTYNESVLATEDEVFRLIETTGIF